jgi:hypothetical protein
MDFNLDQHDAYPNEFPVMHNHIHNKVPYCSPNMPEKYSDFE